jgi:hypothetical protein
VGYGIAAAAAHAKHLYDRCTLFWGIKFQQFSHNVTPFSVSDYLIIYLFSRY